jgi:sulfatase maturation enzyme AslB (radical SAM superfamily)
MNKITPEVIAEMIRDIQRNEYHGDLTITFNGGNVTLVKDSFTHKPDTIFDAYGDAAKPRKTVFVVNRTKKSAPETREETEENAAG